MMLVTGYLMRVKRHSVTIIQYQASEKVKIMLNDKDLFSRITVNPKIMLGKPTVREKSDNPFAVAVMAHLKTAETKGNDDSRRYWKLNLTKNLYRRGFEKQDILNLYRFIDRIMALPEELEQTYHQEIAEFEEKEKMQYVTTAERIGIEKSKRNCQKSSVNGRAYP